MFHYGLGWVRSTQIRYILEGERCPSYPANIGLFPVAATARVKKLEWHSPPCSNRMPLKGEPPELFIGVLDATFE